MWRLEYRPGLTGEEAPPEHRNNLQGIYAVIARITVSPFVRNSPAFSHIYQHLFLKIYSTFSKNVSG